MKTPIAYYLELLRSLSKKQAAKQEPPGSAPEKTASREAHETVEQRTQVVADNDLTISIRMLEEGYNLDDVMKVLRESSPFKKIMKKDDPHAMAVYIDEVLGGVNREWKHRAGSSFASAKNSYQTRLTNLQNKYRDYKTDSFGLYQDGELALDLIRRDGFTPEIAEAVVERCTPNQQADSAYFGTLHDALTETCDRYQGIQDFDPETDIETEADVYRMYAKDFMEKTQTEILSGSDEQKILESIYDRVVQAAPGEKSYYKANPEAFDRMVDTHVMPLLRKGIVDASPVYTEPGRDRDQYVTSQLAEFQSKYEIRKHLSSERYPETKTRYEEKRKTMEKQVESYLDMHSQSYFDGLAAKELLQEHYAPANIIRSIAENTKVEARDIGYPDKEKYAAYVFSCAEKNLHAESEIKAISTIPDLPKGVPAEKLGVSEKELYQIAMKERMLDYPSFELEMSEAYADRDAVEKLLTRYPDISEMRLEQALFEASPRAQLPGASEGYAKSVIRAAKARLKAVQGRQDRQEQLQKKYNAMRGISSQGVQGDNPMARMKDGHITVKMLRRKIPVDDIKSYLVSIADASTTAGMIPAAYAEEILRLSQNVLKREKALADFKPKTRTKTEQTTEVRTSCVDDYMEKMQEEYKKKGFCQPSMDIRVVGRMMAEKKYKSEQVERVVLEHSPVAAEPGRDENYAAYVRRQAELERRKEEERIKNYVAVPRIEQKSSSPLEEYEYQRQKAQQDLGYGPGDLLPMAIDTAIFTAMLAEGFAAATIAGALTQNYTPSGWDESHTQSYGDAVSQQVVKQNVHAQQEQISPTRVRTTITTTTTTTTTA